MGPRQLHDALRCLEIVQLKAVNEKEVQAPLSWNMETSQLARKIPRTISQVH